MADILMPPIVSQVASDVGVDRKAQLPVDKEGSFARHLENKVREERDAQNKLLNAQANKSKANKKESDKEADSPATVETQLQQVMRYLKDLAEKSGTKPGQWTYQIQDAGVLEKLAGQAGMDAGTLALLKKQMAQQGGLPLADLFAALEKNFKELGATKPVTVAETALPLLETFLSKLGVAPEAISKLDGQGVNGLDQLDLTAFLQGLQDVLGKGQDGTSSFTMSDAEFEQFSAMLSEAGVPSEKIAEMFPEHMPLQQKALLGLTPEQGNAPIQMSLDRLASILQQALAAVDGARPKVNLPGFMEQMDTVLSQAGFQSNDVGWSPVVQGAMKASYDHVRDMIAQDQSQQAKTGEIAAKNEALRKEWQMSGTDSSVNDAALSQDGELTADGEVVSNRTADQVLDTTKDDGDFAAQLKAAGSVEMKAAPPVQTDATVKAQAPPRLHFAADLQQFTVDQISQGVLRGLKNNEHHLTLTLYPKELGEVKVDLQVRGSQLSATFVMENQKVKEAMESNMGDFKDNLERRGFSLQSMSVSVGQQDQGTDREQRFVAAWEQIIANQNRETSAASAVNAVLGSSSNNQATLRQGSISLFV